MRPKRGLCPQFTASKAARSLLVALIAPFLILTILGLFTDPSYSLWWNASVGFAGFICVGAASGLVAGRWAWPSLAVGLAMPWALASVSIIFVHHRIERSPLIVLGEYFAALLAAAWFSHRRDRRMRGLYEKRKSEVNPIGEHRGDSQN